MIIDSFSNSLLADITKRYVIDTFMMPLHSQSQSNENIYDKLIKIPQEKKCLVNENLMESIEGECNVASSKIVFLSDVHTDEMQNVARQQYLNQFAKDGDILLLEGYSFSEENLDKKFLSKTHLITSNIKLQGWESEKLYEIAVNKYLILKEIREKIEFETDPNILEVLDREFWALHKTMDVWAIRNRNEFMADKISSLLPLLSENQQIFVIAGKTHLNKELLGSFKNKYSAVFFKDKPNLSSYFQASSRDNDFSIASQAEIAMASKPRNTVLTIKLPDGTKKLYGSAWFEKQTLKVGSWVKFTEDTFKRRSLWGTIVSGLSKEMAESFLNNPEQLYEVVEISR